MTAAHLTRPLLLAVIGLFAVAGTAAAHEPAVGSSLVGGAAGVTDAATQVVEAIAPDAPVVQPVVKAVADTAAPVVTPVAKVAKPVVRVVERVVRPVVEPSVQPAQPAPRAPATAGEATAGDPLARDNAVPSASSPARPAAPVAAPAQPVDPLEPLAASGVPGVLELLGPVTIAADEVVDGLTTAVTPVVANVVEPLGSNVGGVLEPLVPLGATLDAIVRPLAPAGPSVSLPLDETSTRPSVVPGTGPAQPATQPLADGAASPRELAPILLLPTRPKPTHTRVSDAAVSRGMTSIAGSGRAAAADHAAPQGAPPGHPNRPPTGPGIATTLIDLGVTIALFANLLALLAMSRWALRAIHVARPIGLTFAPVVPPA